MRPLAIACAGMLLATVAYPTESAAQDSAITTGALNMRAGPGTGYSVVARLPRGARISLGDCTRNGAWCEAYWGGASGWVSSRYVAVAVGSHAPGYGVAPAPLLGLGFGAIVGSAPYHGGWRDRDWHDRGRYDRDGWDRGRWRGHDGAWGYRPGDNRGDRGVATGGPQ